MFPLRENKKTRFTSDGHVSPYTALQAGVTKSSVTKSKRVVASSRTSSKDGITLQQSSVTSTASVDARTEVVTGKAYDGLNGVTEKTELTNGSDDDYYRPEIECPVSVSKLKDVYISSGKDTVDAEAFREIAVTGIDIKSLKHSYISPMNNKTQVLNHRFAEDIVPIDIKSLKSSFTSVQEQASHNSESGVIEEVKIDKQRLQNKFNKEMKEAINMDDVWVMALSLAIGSLVLVWLLLYVRFGKSIVDNGGKKGVVKDRRFSPPQARNGTRTSPSTNGSHRAQATFMRFPY
ncbi:hypothetical protein HPB50_023648 [Hyalomma asiaticum]|uniref:Uncharacterized protein n=1 Tax=Hyalomma asiaticum TaxID=266040 RepID=A0ACB7T8V7_HYAAI|nr:hypothetical protein HPB50_023648 [Hyalomma asiaticum]